MSLEMLQYQQQVKPTFHNLPTEDSDDEAHRAYDETTHSNFKLKNELCRNFLQYGYCRYNTKCQFAHGIDELRQNSAVNMKYKTKICQSFMNKGHCQYGERCNFLHKI